MSTATITPAQITGVPATLSLELTGRCQLECRHCFASSGPTGDHGTMTMDDWREVIDLATVVGVRKIQFIGGDPTTHPGLPDLIVHALAAGLKVRVFTNLVAVPERLWDALTLPGVTVATSYYTPDPVRHDEITGRKGSHARTRRNIVEALRREVPLHVALLDTGSEADVNAAHAELLALGVTDIGRDRVRPLGRAAAGAEPDPAALCGRCGITQAVVLPDGTLAPCGMGRWLAAGNVRTTPLDELLAGERWRSALAAVPRQNADGCNPDADGEDCSPAERPPCQPEWDA
ncbi:radical SAM/SPASM domain-containing protein [Frankia sp. Mgl5]|uniref:radical SAM/SPASM domain-containing protein n=1 Tax=Frankia sp. Mgl5 TaxID=2933793 RepID=UPI00200BC83A|nr:radical SAM/SPASM domain-containing protein [Frankia sp. Mgl5]MCK9929306.1 radical SAM/SPASM domain-containing protein [Frankia sp. Mgl5]